MGICQSRSYVETLSDLDELDIHEPYRTTYNEPLLKRLRRRIIKKDAS